MGSVRSRQSFTISHAAPTTASSDVNPSWTIPLRAPIPSATRIRTAQLPLVAADAEQVDARAEGMSLHPHNAAPGNRTARRRLLAAHARSLLVIRPSARRPHGNAPSDCRPLSPTRSANPERWHRGNHRPRRRRRQDFAQSEQDAQPRGTGARWALPRARPGRAVQALAEPRLRPRPRSGWLRTRCSKGPMTSTSCRERSDEPGFGASQNRGLGLYANPRITIASRSRCGLPLPTRR